MGDLGEGGGEDLRMILEQSPDVRRIRMSPGGGMMEVTLRIEGAPGEVPGGIERLVSAALKDMGLEDSAVRVMGVPSVAQSDLRHGVNVMAVMGGFLLGGFLITVVIIGGVEIIFGADQPKKEEV